MSVLIKDMEMPKSCAKCKLFGEYGCLIIGAVGYALTRGERNEDCPLVPVPPPGRLIDANKLNYKIMYFFHADSTTPGGGFFGGAQSAVPSVEIKDAPTVIEAEEGE